MRYLIALALIPALLTACSGKKDKDVDPNTGLTEQDYDIVKSINDSFSDLDRAVEIGVNGKGSGNEKATKLAEMIQKAGCKENGKADVSEQYNTNWDATYNMGSNNACPVQIFKEWTYRADSLSRSWNFKHKIDISNNDFRDESVIESFAIHKGELIVQNSSGNQRVTGSLNFSNFKVKDLGLLTASLTTDQNYNKDHRGNGRVTFQLNARKALRVKVLISWNSMGKTTYRINGHNVEENVVNDLFSSFGLLKIKPRSEKMLY